MELSAGAWSLHDRKALRALFLTFRRAGRILHPTAQLYVLIALSARTIGATVITQNGADFEAIQSVRPFRLAVVS